METISYKGVDFTTWDVSGKSVSVQAFLGTAGVDTSLFRKET